jgi:hypothetical protein
MLYPYYPSYLAYSLPTNLRLETLTVVEPWVRHGLKEAHAISTEHALREATAITYLVGKGYNPYVAHQIVESWWHTEY